MERGMDIGNRGTWTAINRLVFWAALTFTMAMATMPQPPAMLGTPSDKLNHIIAFFVLTALHQIAYRDFGFWRRMLVMATLGGVIELVQMVPRLNRDAEWMDWFADVAAAFLASCVVSVAVPNKATSRSEP
jgi:VanZ family protein